MSMRRLCCKATSGGGLLILLLATAVGGDYDYEYEDDSDKLAFLDTAKELVADVGDTVTFPCNAHKSDVVMTFSYTESKSSWSSKSVYFFAADTVIVSCNSTISHTSILLTYWASEAITGRSSNEVDVGVPGEVRKTPRLRKEGNSYILTSIRRSDAGIYICRIETREPIELQHRLIVQFAPKVSMIGPRHRSMLQGSHLDLQCSSEGVPIPSIVWTRLTGRMTSYEQFAKGYTVTINKVDRNSQGSYMCTASNGHGVPSSAQVDVTVEFPPQIKTKQYVVHGGEADTIVLSCLVYGHPTPSVTWMRSFPLSSPSLKYLTSSDGSHRYSLTVRNVSESDFGNYTCDASNNHGSDRQTIRLTGLPGTPKMVSRRSGSEDTTYNLTWVTESTAPILQYRLRYREKTDNKTVLHGPGHWHDSLYSPTETQERKETGSIQSSKKAVAFPSRFHTMYYPLENLVPATEYQTIVLVENKFGWSKPSRLFYFSTRREMVGGQSASTLAGCAAQSTHNVRVLLPLLLLCWICFRRNTTLLPAV